MRYDDASWHESENTAEEINPFAGSTHIGMFVAWAASRNLLGELHTQEYSEDLEKLRSRSITPGEWVMAHCDGKFTDEDLNEEGNLFAQSYYAHCGDDVPYLTDYANAFPETALSYKVPDNWEAFDRIAPIIERRFNAWKKQITKSSNLRVLGLGWLKSRK